MVKSFGRRRWEDKSVSTVPNSAHRGHIGLTVVMMLWMASFFVSAPAAAAETADWVPLQGDSQQGDFQFWCTWDNGCSDGYHCPSLCPAIDIGANVGTPVYAAGPGTAQTFGGCHGTNSPGYQGAAGNHIVVTHPDGRASRYLHLSDFAVGNGAQVKRGQLIGRTGDSGTSNEAGTGPCGCPHLHYDELSNPSDPRSKIDPGPMYALHGNT